MGWVYATSACFGCGRQFYYNPRRVPSIRPAAGMPPEPVCQECVNLANPRRIANGLEPITPFPDAYDPCPEAEL